MTASTVARTERPPRERSRLSAFVKIATSYLGQKYYLFGLRVRLRSAFTRYDLCHAVDVMSLDAVRGFASRGVKVLLDINEIPDPFERQGRHFVDADPMVKRHLARIIARDLPCASALIAASGAMADFVAERFERDATALPNMRARLTAPPSRAIRDDVGAMPDTRVIVYPCTAAPHLGVETAIEALSLLPEHFRLVFVGRFVTPSYREEIERLIRFHRLDDRVTLKGELPDETYLPYIAGADFGLVPLGFTYRNQRLVLPWRVVDLAAAQVPLAVTPSDEIIRTARAFDIGEVAHGTDAASTAAALRALAEASPERVAAIRRDLGALCDKYSPEHRHAQYRATLAALGIAKPGRAAFLFNVALRDNRRAIDFIDLLCDGGSRVDLYAVRGPDPALFRHPSRVRLINIPDRLVVLSWLVKRAGAWTRAALAPPPLSAIGNALAGTRFGLKQIARSQRYARLVRDASRAHGPWDMVIATDIFACAAGLAAASRQSFLAFDATEIPDLKQRSSRFLRRIPGGLGLVFRLWERRFAVRAGMIFSPSQALTLFVRRRYRRKPPATIRTVRNAAAPSREDILARQPDSLRALLRLPESDTILVSPCGISRETGALLAIRTLRFLPADHVLVFIGRFSDAAFAAEARRLVAAEHVAHRVFFLGPFDEVRYLGYLAECDIGLVLFDPAIGNLRLASPNRFFDLLAMEVPMVATRVGDVAAILERNDCGVLIDEHRPAAIAAAIEALHARSHDPQTRAALARVARFYRWAKERERMIELLVRRAGPLAGKRVALLTLRNAGSNRRFRLIGAALAEAGAEVHAFDTRIGAPPPAGERPPRLTTLDVN